MKPAQHGQLDQCLDAAHESPPDIERVLVIQRDRLQRLADVFGQGCVHLPSSPVDAAISESAVYARKRDKSLRSVPQNQ